MKYKKSLLVICLIICLFSVASVSASDANDTIVASGLADDDNIVSSSDPVLLANGSDGTFQDLASEIANVESELNLTRNYVYDENDTGEGIIINKNIIINGNGHTIDANNRSGIFVINNSVTINNLTFINANSNRGSVFNVQANGSLTTSNVVLENNTAGVGVILVFGQYTSINDRIKDSTSSNYGVVTVYVGASAEFDNALMMSSKQLSKGFIYAFDNAYIGIFNSTFANTTSKYSTAVHGGKIVTRIKNSKFINLHANATAGAIALKGSIDSEIINCTFINVTSEKNAGAIFADIYDDNTQPAYLINNSNFVNSYSEFGGAIMQLGGVGYIDNCNFTNNSALFDGGAIYVSYGMILISDSIFDGNHAQYEGTDRDTFGGTIFSDITSLNLFDSIIVDSYAGCGGAIYLYDSKYDVENNIFSNNLNKYGDYDDIYSVFDELYLLDGNSYSGVDTLSLNNTNYETIMAVNGMKLILINATINVTTLPPAFDLRDWGWVTPVRDQGSTGSCWTFGTAGAAESAILRFLGLEMDISENNIKDVSLQYFKYGTNGYTEEGSVIMGAAYALSWFGVFSSEHDTYDELGKISPIIAANDSIHFQDVVFISPRKNVTDNDVLKQALLKYGALGVLYCAEQTAPYYNAETSAQYRNESGQINHAVTLVGWDDNYSASNFLITPPGDGAWIFKNSWGEIAGDKGYFYISYYDPTFVTTIPAVGFVLENTVEYNKNYQYDIGGRLEFVNSSEYLNIFAAVDDDLIAGVGTYFEEANVGYCVEVYVNDDLKLNQSGVSPFVGFHTIQLDSFIPVKKGDIFTVKITSSSTPVMVDSRQHYIENASQYFMNGTWIDATENGQVCCIKVYTVAIKQNTTLVATYDDENGVLTVTLTDDEGNAIADASVVINIGDDTFTNQTDCEGQANFSTKGVIPGNYTATVTYEGDRDYNPSNTTANVEIDKYVSVISADDVNATYNDGGSLVATLTDVNGVAIEGALVKVTLDGVTSNLTTDDAGQVSLSLDGVPVGDYEATIAFDGDEVYIKSNTTANVIIDKSDSVISAADVTATYNSGGSLVATLTDVNGTAIEGAVVEVTLNSLTSNLTTDDAGQVSLSLDGVPVGNYVAAIAFDGNEYYKKSNTTANVVVTKVAVNMAVISAMSNNANSIFKVMLTDSENGNVLAGRTLNLILDGKNYVGKTDENGIAQITAKPLQKGNYAVTLKFSGTATRYDATTVTQTVSVSGFVPVDMVVVSAMSNNANSIFKVRLTDRETGNVLAGRTLNLILDGKNYVGKTDENGIAQITAKPLQKGNTAVTLKFSGTASRYAATTVTQKVYVEGFVPVNMVVVNVVSDRSSSLFRVRLTDSENGNALVGRTLNLILDGKNLAGKTDENGIAKISAKPLGKGSYDVTLQFSGTASRYAATTVTQKVSVGGVSVNMAVVSAMSNNANSIFKVKLTDSENGNVLAGRTLNLILDGKNLAGKTDENGIAQITAKPLGKGSYTVTLKFSGTASRYAATTVNQKVYVDGFVPVKMTVVSAESTTSASLFKVKLTDSENGNVLAGRTLNLILDGKNLAGKTDENGIAQITAKPLEKGSYAVTLKFSGTASRYAATTVTQKVSVNGYITPILTSKGVTTTYGANDYLVVSLTDQNNKPISGAKILFTVFGKKITGTTDGSGHAKISTKGYNPGKYTVVFEYSGDSHYKSVSSSTKMVVNKA